MADAISKYAPGKITLEPGGVLDRICQRIAGGAHVKDACSLEGVSDRSLRELRANREDVEERVAKAMAVKHEMLREKFMTLVDEESRSTNAFLNYMMRANPDNYLPPTQRIEQSGPDGEPIKVAWYLPQNKRFPAGSE